MSPTIRLVIGIDGGGSGSRARVRNAEGAVVSEAIGGPANFYQDFAGALHNVQTLIAEAARGAGVPAHHLHAGLGLAGLVTSVNPAEIRAGRLGVATAVADVDAYTACLGAFGGGDGGIVIAGTGSIGFAVENGTRHMVGGWGMLLGDQGSGAWLGLEAVRHTTDVLDGFSAETALSRAVKSKLGHTMFELSVWSEKATPKDFASLAPLVFAMADGGDDEAQNICNAGIQAISRLGRSLLNRGARRIALLGGLAQRYEPVLEPDVRSCLVQPIADALDGAILMAGGRVASASQQDDP